MDIDRRTKLQKEHDALDKKLEDLRDGASRYGEKYGHWDTAKDYLEITDAGLLESAPKEADGKSTTVPERNAWVRRQPEHLTAVERKKDAAIAWKTAQIYVELTLKRVDMHQTKCANDRNTDKAHQ